MVSTFVVVFCLYLSLYIIMAYPGRTSAPVAMNDKYYITNMGRRISIKWDIRYRNWILLFVQYLSFISSVGSPVNLAMFSNVTGILPLPAASQQIIAPSNLALTYLPLFGQSMSLFSYSGHYYAAIGAPNDYSIIFGANYSYSRIYCYQIDTVTVSLSFTLDSYYTPNLGILSQAASNGSFLISYYGPQKLAMFQPLIGRSQVCLYKIETCFP